MADACECGNETSGSVICGELHHGVSKLSKSLHTFAKRAYIILLYLYELIIQQYREYFTPAQYCSIYNIKFVCILYQLLFRTSQ